VDRIFAKAKEASTVLKNDEILALIEH